MVFQQKRVRFYHTNKRQCPYVSVHVCFRIDSQLVLRLDIIVLYFLDGKDDAVREITEFVVRFLIVNNFPTLSLIHRRTDDIFVHQSGIVTEAEYRTLVSWWSSSWINANYGRAKFCGFVTMIEEISLWFNCLCLQNHATPRTFLMSFIRYPSIQFIVIFFLTFSLLLFLIFITSAERWL
jgi:hypothetical protein